MRGDAPRSAVRIFGIDPGSLRTGYGCVDLEGTRCRMVSCGALAAPAKAALPDRLQFLHDGLSRLIRESSASCVVIENLFHAKNVRSALVLGHARGVAVLAAVQAGLPVLEYTPAEIKLAVVGYGRAEKHQIQHMVKLLLGLEAAPKPHDAADALAVAICHAHSSRSFDPATARGRRVSGPRSWRDVPLSALPRRQAT